jgi:molybdopterin-guanine dinucleotide biosynthesis protein A
VAEFTAAAAIVAGGQARRFGGADKCRLIVGGRPIIVRQIDVLQRVANPVFIVANAAERFADLGVAVQPDAIPVAGALAGLYTALVASPADRVIVVACDLPFLNAGLLARLVERAQGADGAWVETSRGPEPFLACYRTEAAPIIRREIEAGRLRAGDLGKILAMRAIDEAELREFGSPDRLLANVNTPDEYERIQYESE